MTPIVLATGSKGPAHVGPHTFVVPAYGRSPHLADCLASLQAQTLRSPVIVATSTPWDGLESLVADFDATLVVHAPNVGIGHDWNFALAQAQTPLATLAHQDDLYLPEFAERTLTLAERHADAVLIATGYAELLTPEDTRRTWSLMLAIKRVLVELAFLGRDAVASTAAKRRLLRFGCPIPCPAVTLRLDRDSPRFSESLKVDLDWDAWLRLADKPGAFAYDRQTLMLHRIHCGSETSAGVRAGVRAAEDRMMFERLWPTPLARLLARAYALSYEEGA